MKLCEVLDLFKKNDLRSLDKKKNLLFQALENNEFFLEYQPKISILDKDLGKVKSLETLLRWKYKGETISPMTFIEFCERSQIIIPIGDYVVGHVAKNLHEWQKNIDMVPCSINITKEQIHPNYRLLHHVEDLSFCNYVTKILKKQKLPHNLIEFELIERDTTEIDPIIVRGEIVKPRHITFQEISPFLKELHQSNYKLSIDDYNEKEHRIGTIRSMFFSFLKVDKSDVDTILTTPEIATKIFNDFLHYKENYDIPLIVEGVENKNQLSFLRKIQWHNQKVDMVQGHFFSKPVSAEKVPEILEENYFLNKF